eukprot:NODE_2_length_91304_cov_0.692462.p77 type:complete len:117 gc:universal NODE_2_length_91304_cov_0.692462:16742-16392(-)
MKPNHLTPLRIFATGEYSDSQYLPVPKSEKLWLRSPPGSPPLEWKGGREDAPNPQVHHPEEDYYSIPLSKDHPAIIVEDYSEPNFPKQIVTMPLQHKSLVFTKSNPIPHTRLPPET